MGVSGHRHVPPTIYSPGKGPSVPIGQEAGWVTESVWKQRLEEKSFSMPGIEPRSPGRPIRSEDTILTELPWLLCLVLRIVKIYLNFVN
jgi:hypothetical protein